jgi:hypothetical protein
VVQKNVVFFHFFFNFYGLQKCLSFKFYAPRGHEAAVRAPELFLLPNIVSLAKIIC